MMANCAILSVTLVAKSETSKVRRGGRGITRAGTPACTILTLTLDISKVCYCGIQGAEQESERLRFCLHRLTFAPEAEANTTPNLRRRLGRTQPPMLAPAVETAFQTPLLSPCDFIVTGG